MRTRAFGSPFSANFEPSSRPTDRLRVSENGRSLSLGGRDLPPCINRQTSPRVTPHRGRSNQRAGTAARSIPDQLHVSARSTTARRADRSDRSASRPDAAPLWSHNLLHLGQAGRRRMARRRVQGVQRDPPLVESRATRAGDLVALDGHAEPGILRAGLARNIGHLSGPSALLFRLSTLAVRLPISYSS